MTELLGHGDPEQSGEKDDSGDRGVGAALRASLDLPPATPRWVVVFGVILLALALVFVLLHLAGLTPTGHGL